MKHVVAYALLGGALWSMAGGPRLLAAPPELIFTTRVDKTAVWVGDQFHYQITVDHSPGIQFVLENVNKDTINLDPLGVVDAASSSTRLKNGNQRLFVDLILANFTTGVAE